MKKSPINHAIETLQKFSESLEFTKEGKTSVNCSISLLEPFIEEEKKLYIEMCVEFLQLIVSNIENGQIQNFEYNQIVSFVENYFSENKASNPQHYKYFFKDAKPKC